MRSIAPRQEPEKLTEYLCHYRCQDGSRFGSEVFATPRTIDAVLAARNLGEVVDGISGNPRSRYKPLHVLLERDGVTPKVLHHACAICWIALKSGTASVDDILGDCGLLHELLHINDGVELATGTDLTDLLETARRIESAIPGSWLGRDPGHQGETTQTP